QTIEKGRAAEAIEDPSDKDLQTIQAGKEAKSRFIRANIGLVKSVANRQPHTNTMDFNDLCQEGALGLERAVEKFDWRRGFRFSTYGIHWIKHFMKRGIAKKGWAVSLPVEKDQALGRAIVQSKFD